MKQKGGPTNNEHCFHECSAWIGILVHLAQESVFSFVGIRITHEALGFEQVHYFVSE